MSNKKEGVSRFIDDEAKESNRNEDSESSGEESFMNKNSTENLSIDNSESCKESDEDLSNVTKKDKLVHEDRKKTSRRRPAIADDDELYELAQKEELESSESEHGSDQPRKKLRRKKTAKKRTQVSSKQSSGTAPMNIVQMEQFELNVDAFRPGQIVVLNDMYAISTTGFLCIGSYIDKEATSFKLERAISMCRYSGYRMTKHGRELLTMEEMLTGSYKSKEPEDSSLTYRHTLSSRKRCYATLKLLESRRFWSTDEDEIHEDETFDANKLDMDAGMDKNTSDNLPVNPYSVTQENERRQKNQRDAYLHRMGCRPASFFESGAPIVSPTKPTMGQNMDIRPPSSEEEIAHWQSRRMQNSFQDRRLQKEADVSESPVSPEARIRVQNYPLYFDSSTFISDQRRSAFNEGKKNGTGQSYFSMTSSPVARMPPQDDVPHLNSPMWNLEAQETKNGNARDSYFSKRATVSRRDCIVVAQYLEGSLVLISVKLRGHTNDGFSKQAAYAIEHNMSFFQREYGGMYPVGMCLHPNSSFQLRDVPLESEQRPGEIQGGIQGGVEGVVQRGDFPQTGYVVVVDSHHPLNDPNNLKKYLEKFAHFLSHHMFSLKTGITEQRNWSNYSVPTKFDRTENPKNKLGNLVLVTDASALVQATCQDDLDYQASPNARWILEQYFDPPYKKYLCDRFNMPSD